VDGPVPLDAFVAVYSGDPSTAVRLRFGRAFDINARLFAVTLGLEACKAACYGDNACAGVWDWRDHACYGLTSLGLPVPTGTNSVSWMRLAGGPGETLTGNCPWGQVEVGRGTTGDTQCWEPFRCRGKVNARACQHFSHSHTLLMPAPRPSLTKTILSPLFFMIPSIPNLT